MLDVHPVHGSVSGWRDFLVHIVIVAIGLLLALGLGQTVEFIHHRYQVIETRHALKQERADNRQTFAEFVGLLDTFPFWFNIVTP